VLSGRGLCDELITRPEESYRVWCVVVCDLENLVNEEALAHWEMLRQIKKNVLYHTISIFRFCLNHYQGDRSRWVSASPAFRRNTSTSSSRF